MELNFADLSPNQVYHTLIQSIVPRPIAWVLSENQDSSFNLAPFSYFTAIASDPPLIMFSCGKRPDNGDMKDTLVNISRTKNFVIHIASTELADRVALSAAPLAYGESEVDHAKLETVSFNDFCLPKEIGNKPMALVFGEIKHAYISDDILDTEEGSKGKRTYINAERLDPLVRLGGDDYSGIREHFCVERPK